MSHPAARAARSAVAAVLALTAGLVAVVAASLAFAPAAQAVTPTGGCWVWYTGSPPSDISTSLAPWTDSAAAPAGPADHSITLSPASPAPGETVTATYAFNKGPKNSGPAASVSGEFKLDVNGTVLTATKSYGTVGGGQTIPATSVTVQFVARRRRQHRHPQQRHLQGAGPFLVEIDCNGQTSGTAATNPRTTPVPTNITASVTGAGPSVTPSLTPTPTPSESATPTASASPTATTSASPSATATTAASNPGSPAKGRATFACTLEPLGTDFAYPADMTVSGYRAAEGDPVSMTAEMSDMPGIAPLPIDGQMDVTLDLEVGGAKVTLKGGAKVQSAAKQPIPVPDLTGEMELDADEAEVEVTGFTFNFAELSVGATCTAADSLGKMTVGSEAAGRRRHDSGGERRAGGGPAVARHRRAGRCRKTGDRARCRCWRSWPER